MFHLSIFTAFFIFFQAKFLSLEAFECFTTTTTTTTKCLCVRVYVCVRVCVCLCFFVSRLCIFERALQRQTSMLEHIALTVIDVCLCVCVCVHALTGHRSLMCVFDVCLYMCVCVCGGVWVRV